MATLESLKCSYCGTKAKELLEFPVVEKYLSGPGVLYCNDEERLAHMKQLEAENVSIEDMRRELSDYVRVLQKRIGTLHGQRTDNVRTINSAKHDTQPLDQIRSLRYEFEQLKTVIIANKATAIAEQEQVVTSG